jgi:two-component system sensor histidine kinase TctE
MLLVSLLVPLVSLVLLSTAAAYLLTERQVNLAYDITLLDSADSIAARMHRDKSGVVVADIPPAALAVIRHLGSDKFYYQVTDASGKRMTGDAILPAPLQLQATCPVYRDANVYGQLVRMCRMCVHVPPSADDVYVQVAETLNARRRLIEQIMLSIALPQVMLVLCACLVAWWSVGHGLSSLERLARLLKSRSDVDSSLIDIGDPPEELVPVVEALNNLLTKIDHQIQRQRQFTANAAHQLRTPITALMTYVEHAQRVNEIKNVHQVLADISEVGKRVMRLTNKLMALARAEESLDMQPRTGDLIAAVEDATAHLVDEALSKGVQLNFDLPDIPVLVSAAQADLEELVANLLDNAIKYTSSAGSVWLKVEHREQVKLSVEDDGPGISAAEKQRVFERFYRGEQTRTNVQGSGLGLAIVSEIAASSNAEIECLDRFGGGTAFHVTFAAKI